MEYDDYIEINGEIMQKPFVEKPIDANCHRINIYFRQANGGGHQQLFAKTVSVNSTFSEVRQLFYIEK